MFTSERCLVLRLMDISDMNIQIGLRGVGFEANITSPNSWNTKRKDTDSSMKFVHMISQGCCIFKSFEAHVTVDCGVLFMLMYSIEMDFQVVRIRENFLAKLTCSFIKQAYKENIKQRQRHKKDSIYYYWYLWNLLLCIFRACRLLHVLLHNSHTKVFPAF